MRLRNGFSLVETLVAVGIASILGIAVLELMTRNFSSSMRFEQSNEGWLEAIHGATQLNSMIKGIARLDPPEDLLDDDDGLYSGVTNLAPALAPAACDLNPAFGIFRLTSFATNMRSERLLRVWSSASVNQSTPADELRLTYDAGSGFALPIPPTEIYIVDADGNWRRRFPIQSFQVRNTNLDPYDDLPKTDAGGNPISFTYVAVLLGDAKRPDGSATAAIALDFLTSSIAIPTQTWAVCMSLQGQLVKIREVAGAVPDQLMRLTDGHLIPLKFSIDFANSREDARTDSLLFYKDLANQAGRECVSLVRFSVEVANTAGKADSDPLSTAIKLSRTVLIENFLPLRPIACP